MVGLGIVGYIVGYVAGMATLGYFCGRTRGHGAMGAVLGVILGPIGIVIAMLLPPPRPRYEYRSDPRLR